MIATESSYTYSILNSAICTTLYMITKCVLCALFVFVALVTACGVCTGEPVFYTDETVSVDRLDRGVGLLAAVHQEYGTLHVPHDLYLFYPGKFYDDTTIFEKNFRKHVEFLLDQRGKQWWLIGSMLLEGSTGREPGNTYLDALSRYGRFASEYKALHAPVPASAPTSRPTTKVLTPTLFPKLPTLSAPCHCAGVR